MADIEKVDGEIVTGGTAEQTTELQKLEFRLINPTEGNFLRRIDWNKDELETAVKARVAAYQNVAYTEEMMKEAKTDRAELNKLAKRIEEGRKKVKDIVNEPYAVFEAELKEVTQIIKDATGPIDQQIKEFENQQKDQKKQKLLTIYQDNIGELSKILPFEKIFDQRYLNATFSFAKASQEIKDNIQKVKTDLETIDGMDSKYVLNVKDVYVKTLDLSKAMAENKRLKDLEEKLEADRKAKEEEERKRLEAEAERKPKEEALEAERQAEENKKEEIVPGKPENEPENVENETENEETEQTVPENEQTVPESTSTGQGVQNVFFAEPEKRYKATFYCIGTLDQIKALGKFMRDNNMEYGKVEK